LTHLDFDQHHFESPEALAAASERGAKKVHDTVVTQVRSSIESDKKLEADIQPSASSSILSTLGTVAYSPIALAGYVRSNLPSLPFTSKTPSSPSSTVLASFKPIDEDFVLVSSPSALISSGPIIYDDYQGSSTRCTSSKEPWKVVASFDGGGIRGAIGTDLVVELERRTNRKLWELVDSAIGTSIGGIQVLGYMSTRDGKNPLMDGRTSSTMFDTKFKRIFQQRSQYNYFGKIYDSVTDLFYSQHPDGPINQLLQEEFGDLTLFNTLRPVTTTAFNPDHDAPFLFSSDLTPRYKLWQVARSGAAAPTYWDLFRPDIDGSIVDQSYLGDGGLTYNNPAWIGILEQKRRAPQDFSLDYTVLFSVGTGWTDVEDKLPYNAGILRAAKPVINAVINSQVIGTERAMETLLKSKNNFRFNPKLPKHIALDEWSTDILRDLRVAAESQYGILEDFIDHPAIRAKLEAPRESDAF